MTDTEATTSTPRWFGLTARVGRLDTPCTCELHHGDPVRILGGSDYALVVTIGHRFVDVRLVDGELLSYTADELRIVA